MEALDQDKVKESRTQKLLKSLKVPEGDFVDEALPSRVFSYSQYNAFKICGKAYEFKYIQKLSLPNYSPLVRGVAVHAGLEHVLREKMAGKVGTLEAGLAVADARFNEAAESVVDWGPDEDGSETNEDLLRKQVHALVGEFMVKGYDFINPVGIEEGFAKKVGGIPMVGWIDLVDSQPAIDVTGMAPADAALVPKKIVVVDFKTSAKTWSADAVRRNPQLTLYAGVKGTPHIRIDQLVTTKKVKYVQSPSERTPDDVEVLTEDLVETVDLIKKGVFPKTTIDNWCCNPKHCSWWDKCRGKKNASPVTEE